MYFYRMNEDMIIIIIIIIFIITINFWAQIPNYKLHQ